MANFCYFNAKYAAENGSQLDSRPSFGAHNVNEAVTFFNSTGDSPTMKLGSEPGTSSSIIDLDIKSRHKNENLSEMSSNAHTGAKEEVKEVGKDVGSSVDEFPCPLLTCTFRGPKVVQHLMSRHRLTRRQGLAILMPVEFDYNNGKAKGVSKGKKYCPIAGCVRRIRKGQTLGSHLRTDHGFKRRQGIQTAKKLYPPDGICNFKPFGAMLDACDEAESEGSDDEESASNKQTLQSDQAQGFSDVPNLYQSRMMGVLGIDAILDEQMMPAAKPEVPKQYLRWPFAAQRSAYDKHVENYNRWLRCEEGRYCKKTGLLGSLKKQQ